MSYVLSELLAVGPTSITISVEWPLDMEMEETSFELIGKLDIKERGWRYLESLEFDQPQGKGVFEVSYNQFGWFYHPEVFPDWEKKAWFGLRERGRERVPVVGVAGEGQGAGDPVRPRRGHESGLDAGPVGRVHVSLLRRAHTPLDDAFDLRLVDGVELALVVPLLGEEDADKKKRSGPSPVSRARSRG